MTPEEIKAATLDIEDNFPDIDFDTRQQFIDYVTSRYEYPKPKPNPEEIRKKIQDKINTLQGVKGIPDLVNDLAQLYMDEIDFNYQLNNTIK